MKDSCAKCVYACRGVDGVKLECHRRAPTSVPTKSQYAAYDSATVWPVVRADDFCGEFDAGPHTF